MRKFDQVEAGAEINFEPLEPYGGDWLQQLGQLIGTRILTAEEAKQKIAEGDISWKLLGQCSTDPDLFYPTDPPEDQKCATTEPDKHKRIAAAKAICNSCPVETQCLEEALRNDEKFGVWGGYSEYERKRLKKSKTNKRNKQS